MNILLASNSFKECASSSEINDCVEQGILLFQSMFLGNKETITIKKSEICDGGTGFASILALSDGGYCYQCESVDPLGRKINSIYGVSKDEKSIYIEVAETCGLARLLKTEQNPMHTTSAGVGMQVINAIEVFNPRHIYIGCGDTAINDFGLGFLQALGAKFYDDRENEVIFKQPTDFLNVVNINVIDSKYLKYLSENCLVTVCCNLSSIIGGSESNTKVYAKQKGASDSEIEILEQIKNNFLKIIEIILKEDVSLIPGTGAGGGIGTALYCFSNAKLKYSFEAIFPEIKIEEKIKWADLIITGEGLLDNSSVKGKAPVALALLAKKHNKKVAIITGAMKTNSTHVLIRGGIDYIETLTSDIFDLQYYIKNAKILIRDASFRLMKKVYH